MSKAKQTKAKGGQTSTRKKKQNGTRKSAEKASFKQRLFKFGLKIGGVALILFACWTVYLDAQVRDKFEGKRWQLPAQVFARPLELFPGTKLRRQELQAELEALGYQRGARISDPGSFAAASSAINLYTRPFAFPDGEEGAQKVRVTFSGDEVRSVSALGGNDLGYLRLEPVRIGGIYPAQREDRILVNLQQVPTLLQDALVQVEDRKFYDHHGVSPMAILRAAWVNARAGRVVQGGSTLTQQLVKNFYLTSQQTLWRKANEAIMALLLDAHYSKEEILEAYLNEVYLGQAGSHAIHGFAMGSRFYFGKRLNSLRPHEIALLVGLVKGASYYNPRRHPDRALARRNLVLKVMGETGLLSSEEVKKWKGQPLGVVKKAKRVAGRYPAFMQLVKQRLAEEYPEEDLQTEGLQIFTTLDPRVQRKAEQALADTIAVKEKAPGNEELQGALITTSVSSGEVLAIVGDRNASYRGFNRALEAERQIGSLVKPFVLLTALRQKDKYTLATPISDEPFVIKFENGDEWAPQNYDKESHGDVIMQEAIAQSYNLASARLGLELGVDQVLETLQSFGMEKEVPAYPSVLLGALSLTPWQVTQLYQNLASTGFRTPLRAIRAVTRPDGTLLSRYSYATQQVMAPEVAYIGQYSLYDVMRSGTGRSVYSVFPEDYQIAGKTGTTDDSRDSWFVGFDGQFLTTVWMGKDSNKPTTLTGASGALAAWTALYRQLPQTSLEPVTPSGIDWAWIDARSGLLSAEHCEGAIALPFLLNTAPVQRDQCIDRGNILERWLRRWWG